MSAHDAQSTDAQYRCLDCNLVMKDSERVTATIESEAGVISMRVRSGRCPRCKGQTMELGKFPVSKKLRGIE